MTRLTIAEARTLSVTALSAHGYTADEASIIADTSSTVSCAESVTAGWPARCR